MCKCYGGGLGRNNQEAAHEEILFALSKLRGKLDKIEEKVDDLHSDLLDHILDESNDFDEDYEDEEENDECCHGECE